MGTLYNMVCKFKKELHTIFKCKGGKKMKKMTFNESSKKRLEETYLVVYAIKNQINLKKGEYIEPCDIYTLVGIDIRGFRQLINIYQDKVNNNRYWLDIFESLKARGVKNILFLSVDDNHNMKRTAKIAFPKIKFVDSITYITPKFYKYTNERNSTKLASVLHELYTLKTSEEFKKKFEVFKATYNNSIHQKLIEKYLNNMDSYYKMSVNIRELLFKHTSNLRLYDKIRLLFNHNKNYIDSIEEIYDKLGNLEDYFGYTSFKKKEWTYILNDLILQYPEIEFI